MSFMLIEDNYFQSMLLDIVVCLTVFVLQSLPIVLFRQNLVLRLFPISFVLFPIFYMLLDVTCNAVPLRESVLNWSPVLLSVTIGDIFGWRSGFQLRKMVESMKAKILANEEEQERDDS